MKTMKVYFDVPAKRSVVLLEVDVANYSSSNMEKMVGNMMGAEGVAIAIDRKTYQRLKKEYTGD